MATYTFSFPTAIHFGGGTRNKIASVLKSNSAKRPLIVTDRGLSSLPIHEELMGLMKKEGLEVASFSDVWGNPVKSQVSKGVEAFKKHKADSIIGFGGGAALDVAKAIALMATHPGDLFDYEDDKPGARPIDGPIPYWVAIPTTAGTGSEVGRSSVISDDETHLKKIIFSPKLLARAVFADPELTTGLPAKMTAATGMDALTHCVESYLAKGYHPICDGIALEGLHLIAGGLEQAVKNPNDLEARGSMLMGSMMGAIAFQKGLGITHSCAHALSTVADFHHGLANGVMIDFALSYNVETSAERFNRMAQTVGLKDQSPKAFLKWLSDLKIKVGVPKSLKDAGVNRDKMPKLVDIAIQDVCHQNNPRVCTRETFEHVFSEALS